MSNLKITKPALIMSGIYCYLTRHPREPRFTCPRTNDPNRQVTVYKFGRATEVSQRCQQEFDETLCQYHPPYSEVNVKLTDDPVTAERQLKAEIQKIADQLGVATLSVFDSKKKELFYLTDEEYNNLFLSIAGTKTDLEEIMRGTFRDTDVYLTELAMKIDADAEFAMNNTFVLGPEMSATRAADQQARVQSIVNSKKPLNDLLAIKRDASGVIKGVSWKNKEIGRHQKANSDKFQNYRLTDLKYDIKHQNMTIGPLSVRDYH